MIYSRKGLSDIITNVLIILLVLVAIGIVWAFVKPVLDKGGGKLEGADECLTVDIKPVSCVRGFPTGGVFNVSYIRNAGQEQVQEVKFVFTDANGNSRVNSTTTSIPLGLETKKSAFADESFKVGTWTAETAVVIKTSNPAGLACTTRSAPVACT